MDSVLRPRDIQARIRSGESPETVAAAAQTSVDKIMGFATPVLAERAYVAEQALKASVRRRAGDGPVGHLGEAVGQRLATREVDALDVEWDAWRREDGRWTLVADYPSGSGLSSLTRAQFVYDVAGRYVMAEDDEARWLVGERAGSPAQSGPAQPTAQQAAGHAAGHAAGQPTQEPTEHVTATPESVVETVFEPADPASEQRGAEPATGGDDPEQLPLGDDAIGVVTGLRSVPRPPAADDWMLTQASERAQPPRRTVEEPAETLFDDPVGDEPAASAPADPAPAEPGDDSAAAALPAQGEPAAEKAEKPRKTGKSKRASVPSWDEIMFGSGKGE